MIQKKKRIVLYFPQQADPKLGAPSGKDLLPLSLLTIAGIPDREGYEVVLIDGNLYPAEEAFQRTVEACEGALLYATTGILGYQLADGYLCSQRVKAAHRSLPMFIGGWFASVAPECQLATGLYDAVALGQGEHTFRDLVHAVECGASLESVPGLALLRDGQVVRTPHRTVVGWNELLNCPWHLLDIEPYRQHQLKGRKVREVERMPTPPGYEGKPFFGISYFSSFGCPEPCTFCCSPEVTGARWKCMNGDRMVDDLCALQERWKFDTVRFYDANWGVMEKRTREFCQGLQNRGARLWWYCLMQAFSILRYKPETLDLMRDSGMYVAGIGGETGDKEMMRKIGKHTQGDDNLRAAMELDRRGICSWVTYIIGYPHERASSMMNTIDQCRRIASACRLARPTVWPYRPIPGTAMYQGALELGYRAPTTPLEWGTIGEYHLEETWPGKIPPQVARARKLFEHYSTLSLGLARGRIGWWERRAERRMRTGNFRGGLVEARAFHLFHALTGGSKSRSTDVRMGHRTSVLTGRA
jgi:radical SAM superfamily enzyme YgiQ (UPF0313 family)